jgi:acyl-CoA synthetase (AMP-forming)/AMP-acid ligase II
VTPPRDAAACQQAQPAAVSESAVSFGQTVQTLADLLPARAAEPLTATRPALLFESDLYSYADLDAASSRVAQALRAAGIGPGDVVCQVMASRPEMVVNLFGVFKAGATYAPLNPALTTPELAEQLGDCRPRLIVVDGERLDRVAAAGSALAGGQIWNVDGPKGQGLGGRLGQAPADRPAVAIDPNGPAVLFYSSGTTGRPKGIQLSHRALLTNAGQVLARTGAAPDDRLLVVMPIFHANGLCNQTILPALAGASVVLQPRFLLDQFWGWVAHYQPTYFTAVPTLLSRLVDAPPDRSTERSSLRFVRSGAAPLPLEVQRRFEARFGLPVVVSYGLAEATCTVTMNPPGWERRLGSVGTVLEGLALRVVDAHGADLPRGEVGEVAVQGPTLMLGYHGRPEATLEAVPDGWLRTGDLGYLERDGHLFLTDRKKDVINRGGENIASREVEEALYAHPAVAEAAVVGLPDREYGERVLACVVLKPGREADQHTLLVHCRARLARFKVPERLELLDELPKNAVGKIAKTELRQRYGQ